MKRLFNSLAGNASFEFFVPNGQYAYFVLVYSLTNAAAVTMTRDNLGTMSLQWNGKDVISSIDIDFLNRIANVYGGVSAFSSAVGAAAYAYVPIPCGEWWDSLNVYDIGESDKVSIRANFPDLANAAICAGGNVTVYGIEKVGIMNYLHKITSHNVVMGGSGSQTDTIYLQNVGQVYLKDAVANLVTRYQLSKDNKLFYDADVADLVANSDWLHVLETTDALVALELSQSKTTEETVGSQISFTVTVSGATTVEQYFSSLEFTPQKAIESQMRSASILRNKLAGTN